MKRIRPAHVIATMLALIVLLGVVRYRQAEARSAAIMANSVELVQALDTVTVDDDSVFRFLFSTDPYAKAVADDDIVNVGGELYLPLNAKVDPTNPGSPVVVIHKTEDGLLAIDASYAGGYPAKRKVPPGAIRLEIAH